MHQQGFNQKRKQHFINNAREIFERLQQNGQLQPERFFSVTLRYFQLVPERS